MEAKKDMKLRNLLMFVLVATAMISLAPPASAHHSFAAEYDADKPVTLTGTVTKMAWINPHSWIYIDVKKARRNRRELGRRGGTSRNAGKSGVHEEFPGCRHGDQSERLPREGRSFESERTRYYVAGWAIALRGRIKPGCAKGVPGDREIRSRNPENTSRCGDPRRGNSHG